jgi:hypothetical protein
MPELAGEIEKACGARANPPHSRALANVLKNDPEPALACGV